MNRPDATAARISRMRPAEVGAALLAAGVVYLGLLKLTTTSQEGDFLDSGLFGWAWLLFPAVAYATARVTPRGAGWWGWLLVLPQAVAVVVEGAWLHSPDHGASLWPVGLGFVMVLGLLAALAAEFGRSQARTAPTQ